MLPLPQSMFATAFLHLRLHKCSGKCNVPCAKHRCDKTCLDECLRKKLKGVDGPSIPVDGDYLRMKHVKQIKDQLDTEAGEEIVFSTEMLKKSSGHGLMQERSLLVTSERVINVKGQIFRRNVPIKQVKALTKSPEDKNSLFVLHI